jgi:hypothetical protein
MAEQSFTFRKNPNGSSDSICLICFATVATATSTDNLEKANNEHICKQILSRRKFDHNQKSKN